jgi:dTDP-4-dehydrorhamnose reductase
MKGLILVTGSEGLVGSRFVEISERKNFLHLPKEVELDITDKSEVKAIIDSYNFTSVVHFAAFTDVAKAEEENGDKNGACWQVNVDGTRNLVDAVKPHKARIHYIHISTDMVFLGRSEDPGPYKEDHVPEKDPTKLTWYGFTKAEAERVISDTLDESATILRINYPVRVHFEGKLDYIRKHLKLFDEGGLYPLFTDQQMSISFIDEVCRAIDKIIIEGKKGIYHAASSDTTTPYKLISYVLEKARGVSNVTKPITLREFLEKSNMLPQRYPKYGGLKVAATEQRLGLKFSSWKQIVDKLVEQGLDSTVEL